MEKRTGYAEAYEKGDFEKAIQIKKELLAVDRNLSPEARISSEVSLANLEYLSGGTENQKTAIENLKKVAIDTGVSAKTRSIAINNLASYYYEDRSPDTFNLIFSGPWKELYNGDVKLALRKLSELSYDIYPNTGALLRTSYWYNGQLIDHASEITEVQKSEYLDTIRKNLQDIDALALREYGVNPVQNNRYASFLHRRAFTEAVLAMVVNDITYEKKFQEDYEQVLTIYKQGMISLGASRVSETVPYTYFYYASFVNQLYGEKEREKVLNLTKALATFVSENKEKMRDKSFVTFIKEEWGRPVIEKDHNYRFFMALAEISSPFKKMLIEYGWDI